MRNVKLSVNVLEKMKDYPVFFQKVWIECAKIPKGKTLSYGEVANPFIPLLAVTAISIPRDFKILIESRL